jgi:hypothetical protein
MIAWLGGRPDAFCSAETARRMAMAALLRAIRLEDSEAPRAGVASTSSLATDRPKQGPHRVHVAVQTVSRTVTRSLEFRKDIRGREEEERLVMRLVLNMVAEACGLDERLELELLEGERVEESETVAPQAWQDLLLGRLERVCQAESPPSPSEPTRVVFPGGFNPIHAGHHRMAEIAAEQLGQPVHWEISILNVDKPPLDYTEIERRCDQFDPDQTVWLTRADTFEAKSRLFPGATFVVGVDTLRRIAADRYYGGDPAACQAALGRIATRGCRFLVFGRNTGAGFLGLHHLDLPEPLRSLCREVPQEQFREDVSSTEIRRSVGW